MSPIWSQVVYMIILSCYDDGMKLDPPGTNVSASDFSLPQPVADKIGKLVMDRFAELITGHVQHSRRKVLAGVVLTKDDKMEDMTVISVSTGTKCINGEHMSVNGNSLNGIYYYFLPGR